MKYVLIVDDEPSLLRSIESGFENQQNRFQVLTAANGKEALEVLERQSIDLVITDLRMSVMDGFELLAEMSSRFPTIPNVVMSAFGTPKIEKQLASQGTFRFLDKPVDFDTLDQCINDVLDTIDAKAGSLSGISLDSFLQLVEVEQKTCTLFVFGNSHHKGVLHFQSGNLLNATCGELSGSAAVIEMVTWDNVKIAIHELTIEPTENNINVTNDLMFLLMEGARLKDEAEADHSFLDEEKFDLDTMKPGVDPGFDLYPEGGSMAGLKEILKEMASEMDGVLAIQVTGTDGISIAVHNPAGADVDAFAAKFAMVMKLIEKSINDLKNLGDFEENLVQTQNSWVLTRFVGAGYYMGIVVSREGTLGNVRLVAGKYQDRLRKSL
jgi:CheY-like chemotaxis protein